MRIPAALSLLLLASALAAPAEDLLDKIKDLAFAKKSAEAMALAESTREGRSPEDPELLAALSWAARAAAIAEDWTAAESYARETNETAARVAARDGVDSAPALATALGASIEVLGQLRQARGDRHGALAYLKQNREAYRGTSIETRIQKNYLLASLEGSPMPAIEAERHLGSTPPASTAGKVVVYYFWAHWCPTSKRQKPALISLHDKYAAKGLAVVGPTKLFGFASKRDEKMAPDAEIAYIEGDWQTEHPLPEWMPKPLNESFFADFGISTTPTLVIVDRQGVVRNYHPGPMTMEELEAAIAPLL